MLAERSAAAPSGVAHAEVQLCLASLAARARCLPNQHRRIMYDHAELISSAVSCAHASRRFWRRHS